MAKGHVLNKFGQHKKARIPAGTKLPLELMFCQKGETTNQLKWRCVWQFRNCGLRVLALYGVLRYYLESVFPSSCKFWLRQCVLSSRRAELKSFCNSIGWHSSRSCNQILQERGKTVYEVWQLDLILYFFACVKDRQ